MISTPIWDCSSHIKSEEIIYARIQKTQKEDMKSTAYSFTSVSIIGIILLVLFLTGVFPVQVAGYMKVMLAVIMGATLVLFLIIGLHSFANLKKLNTEADAEEHLISEITKWFQNTYTTDDIDQNSDREAAEETLYFARYEVMKQLILAKYPELEEDFLDNLIETLYADIF